MELYTGRRLFNVNNGTDQEHLQLMEALLGPIPSSMIFSPVIYPATAANYTSPNKFSISHLAQQSAYYISPLQALAQTDAKLFDLVMKMLAYEPSKRISARDALKHSY